MSLLARLALAAGLASGLVRAERACEPVQLRIPGEEPKFKAPYRFMRRDTALYLAAFLSSTRLEKTGEESVLDLGCFEDLSPALRAAVSASREGLRPLEPYKLRLHIGRVYLETRTLRHPDFEIPERLEDFLARTGFRSWPGQVVPVSQAKGLTRALYDSPDAFAYEISVAQTHETRDGNLGTPVRETEVIIRRSRASDDWDFYSYDKNGRLSTTSEFKGGPRPVPSFCMGCHYDAVERRFSPRLRPFR